MLSINDIVKIFEEIELRLVRSLKLNLSRHKAEEQEYGFDWSAWQAEKLRSLQEFRRTNAAIMLQYTSQIDNETRQIMQAEFAEGMNGVDAPPDSPQFFGVDNTKVNKLIDDITYLEKNAETAALRMTDDVYRQTVNRVQLAMGTGSMTLQQAIDIAVKDFLNQGINCIMYKDGRRVNIADYVRMALRTTATRATLQGKSAKFKALGYDTVQVSQYSMCSETCEPYQGRIYIEDTFSLWDGEVQEHGDMLWGKSNYCGKWFPLLSEAIRKGLFHPNCRHTILMWRDGDPIPESINNEDSERRYKLEQQQRKLENAVRKAKRKVEGLSDPENVKKAKAELRDAQKQLKDFIDKVNADEGETILKRDYGREKIYSDIPKNRIDNSSESGIIRSIDVDDYSLVTYGRGISDEVSNVIINTMRQCERDGRFVISEISTTVTSSKRGTSVLQIEPLTNGLLKLNINVEYLSGKNLEEIDKAFFNAKHTVVNSLEEAVIHESGHAISIKGKNLAEIKKTFQELKDVEMVDVSEIAFADGAECLAELEVLKHRGTKVSKKLSDFYKKYMGREY